MESVANGWMWASFAAVVATMLAIDLLAAGGGRGQRMSLRAAATWSAVWVAVSLAFAAGLWVWLAGSAGEARATRTALEFLTGYVIEKSLAVDNVFVWLMLFAVIGVPIELQRRVLIYGVLGAIVLRTIMIFAGAWLITQFHWLLYLFGGFLLVTGIKMFWLAGSDHGLSDNPLLRWLRARLPLTDGLRGERFIVVEYGVRLFTPLFLALVMVEFSDIIFAVDSIPAIFAITTDPFIVLTSNVFAILGLRAMYFLLADMADRFSLLKYGLAAVLVFIGAKMLLVDFIKVPVGLSLAIVAALIGGSVWLSLRRRPATGAVPPPL